MTNINDLISFNFEATTKRNKGKSLVEFIDNMCIVDVETTGLMPQFDEIIEIAILKIRDKKIVKKFQTLVKPTEEVDEFITELTGITNEMLSTAPDIETVLSSAIDFIGEDIIVGHNVNFDVNFLYDDYCYHFNKELKNDYIDTLRLSRKLLPELKSHKLNVLIEHFKIEKRNAHRAEQDCLMTFDLYCKLEELCLSKYDSIENFKKAFKKKSTSDADMIKSLSAQTNEIDVSNPLYEKVCVFTGTLERMVRKDAMQIVLNCGGILGNSVTKKTNYLILGNNDYCSSIKDGKSSKQKKAEEYKLKGYDIEIIPENVFYDMLNE